MGHVMESLCATSSFQHCNSAYVDSTIFMQDGASLHIATPVNQLLTKHFGNGRIFTCHFPTAWPPLPYLNLRLLAVGVTIKDASNGVRL
ncbi:hypothetical protein AVEN_157359-1 [Araneus ventricosus]|uniref:Uncharacterized protein n=1 Tax=Araneus ventricosus TaxID=182803 RepID=A0A4Y2GVB7_ARAVE|nr:hypothetical protein AVEN_157359-1 [Araneus ventricosus]